MTLKILLPFGIFAQKTAVLRVIAETRIGSFGILPHRLDCVASLAPGILTYETARDGIAYLAVDEGVLVKTGEDIYISVRNAVGGVELEVLHETVKRRFLQIDQQEQEMRQVIAKMEVGLLGRLAEFHDGH